MKLNGRNKLKVVNLTNGSVVLNEAELAECFSKRLKGLWGRKYLPPGEGMIIYPCRMVHTLGMAFPLDLGFVDYHGRLCRIFKNVPPWRLGIGAKKAHFVIEAPAGTFELSNTCESDLIGLQTI